MGRMHTDGYVRLGCALGHAENRPVEHPLGSLMEMLGAAVGDLAVDAAVNPELAGTVQGGDHGPLSEHLTPGQGDEAGEFHPVPLSGGAGPGQGPGQFSRPQIQHPQVALHPAAVHGETLPIQGQFQIGDVRSVGQLRHLLLIEAVEGAVDQHVAGLADVFFLKGGPLAQISAAQAENGFTFPLAADIEGGFGNQPVFLLVFS